MKKNKLFILALFIILSSVISGCAISVKKKEAGGNDLGVFKTDARGDRWAQKVLIPTTTVKPKSMAQVSASALAIDPSDEKAIYLGSEENGLFYTYDGANGWQRASGLGNISIKAVTIDPDSKCIIYVASENKVFKSTDCNRTWSQVYFDNDTKVKINTIAIDHYDSKQVYIGTSRGEIIKSSDQGESWQTLGRFKNDVEKIVISPQDSRVIFVATQKGGIHRSIDNGVNWVDFSEKLEEFKDGKEFRDLAVSAVQDNLVILATRYGLLKSNDNGDNWSKIELITPEKDAVINSLALGPKDAKEIYYITNTTFYRSLDGGENWTSKKLPSTGRGQGLVIDFEDPSIVYMGIKQIPKR